MNATCHIIGPIISLIISPFNHYSHSFNNSLKITPKNWLLNPAQQITEDWLEFELNNKKLS